jgi:Tol biopolymer transport system component
LWTVDADGKNLRRATRGAWKINDFEWLAPDCMIAIASNQPPVERWNDALYTISPADGKVTRFGEPKQPFGGLSVSADRKLVAYSGTRDDGPVPHDLYLTPAENYNARNVTASINRSVVSVKWQNSTTAVIAVVDGFRRRLFRLDPSSVLSPIDLPSSVGDYDVARDGTII